MIKWVGLAIGLFMGICAIPAAAQPYTQCIATVQATGTANAITSPSLPCALTTNLVILTASSANTSAVVTYQPLGLPTQAVVRPDGSVLNIGDIAGVGYKALLSPNGTKWYLLNPGSVSAASLTLSTTAPISGSYAGSILSLFLNPTTGTSAAVLSNGPTINSPSLLGATANTINFTGSVVGTTQFQGPATGSSGVITLPSGTTTLGALALTQTWTGGANIFTNQITTNAGISNANAILLAGSAGTSGNVLTSQGAGQTPVWSSSSGGSGTVSSGTIGQLGYYAGTGTTISGNSQLSIQTSGAVSYLASTIGISLMGTGILSGTAIDAQNIDTVLAVNNQTYFPSFVVSGATATQQQLRVSTNLSFNPNLGNLGVSQNISAGASFLGNGLNVTGSTNVIGTVTSGTLSGVTLQAFNTFTTTSISAASTTLVNNQCGQAIQFSNTAAGTLILPNSLSNCNFAVSQLGAGAITLSAASGASITQANCPLFQPSKQFSMIAIFETGNSGGSSAVYNLGGDCK